MKDNEFKCAMCGGVFEKSLTDEEAFEEYKKNFPEEAAKSDEHDIVCDDCYKVIMEDR